MKHFKSALLLALATALASSISTAQLVLDQQPTQKFALRSYAPNTAVAENFTITDPNGAAIVTIDIWGTWTPMGLQTSDTFDVIFHSDVVGPPPFLYAEPGPTLQTYTGIVPIVAATGTTMPASSGPVNPEYKISLTLPAPMVLAPGTYWVEIYSTSSSGTGELFEWEMAALDPVAGVSCVSWSGSTPGVTWNSCTPYPEKEMAIRLFAAQPGPLFGSPAQVSLSAGGTQTLFLDAGAANAGVTYLLLGSVTGTLPGLVFDGLTLPLNPDAYFIYTLTSPNAPPLASTLSTLDASGMATASLTIPPGSPATHAGLKINHAYMLINLVPVPYVSFVSNAAEVELIL